MTLNRKKANFRGHYVSYERTFRGHLKKSRAKSPFFEGQRKPWDTYYVTLLSHHLDYLSPTIPTRVSGGKILQAVNSSVLLDIGLTSDNKDRSIFYIVIVSFFVSIPLLF